jgi:hypothetical protein
MSKNNTATREAGKPALYGKAMKRYQVILNDETVTLALELGNGNLSAGLRALAAANKACNGFAAGRVKNKGSAKAANR